MIGWGDEPSHWRRNVLLVMVLLAIAAGFFSGWYAANSKDAYCPTEDSCRVDYSHGHYTIVEVTP